MMGPNVSPSANGTFHRFYYIYIKVNGLYYKRVYESIVKFESSPLSRFLEFFK